MLVSLHALSNVLGNSGRPTIVPADGRFVWSSLAVNKMITIPHDSFRSTIHI